MPDPTALSSDNELRALVERALAANYELDREIGRGGMGIVYRAKDRRLKRTVAVKLLPPELAYRSEIRSRFLREAETAAQLSHPNIVPIYSVDEKDGIVYFVMACIDGSTLARRLSEEGYLPIEDARRFLIEVADALAYAHARGVVHRDIKPDNILIDADSGRAMVTDFGIARAVQEGGDARLTATGVAIGTPAYMSPEQAAGDREIDGRSDLYSLGVVGYQMLTGQTPFQAASTPSMLIKHISEYPMPVEQRRPDVPPDVANAVMMLLEKEPERRFSSANTLAAVLRGDAPAPPRTSGGMRPSGAVGTYGGGGVPISPVSPYPATGGAPYPQGGYAPPPLAPATPVSMADDLTRWSAPDVQKFRKQFATYAAVNAVIVLAALFTDTDFMWVTVIYSIVMAVRYSKLWSAGFDWRDVFHQPRDRRLVDVGAETVDEVRAIFRRGDRRALPRSAARAPALPAGQGSASPFSDADFGTHASEVRQAAQYREEIAKAVVLLPRSDQRLVDDVVPTSSALLERVRHLAISLTQLEREHGAANADKIEREIEQLESQANPFDKGTEDRVRRLAMLKRQRRGMADVEKRRKDARSKLDGCLDALRQMRLDVLRLRAGGVASQNDNITMLTERARRLADEVDAAVVAVDEARRDSAQRMRGELGST